MSEAGGLPGGIVAATVMHKRLRPRPHLFAYRVPYLCVPLDRIGGLAGRWLRVDRPGLAAFHRRDHGPCDGGDLDAWARRILAQFGLAATCDGRIELMALPRMLGYVFNPVSFWFCRDAQGGLRAVLCEVRNTFGERHNYLVFHDDRRPIAPGDWLEGRKAFHVSPFLPVEGRYRFRFRLDERAARVDVNYDDAGGPMLLTSVAGARVALTDGAVLRRFLANPWLTVGVVVRIHWQAARLWLKKAAFHRKPEPPREATSR